MAKVHYCTCRVNLSGQNCHIVHFDRFNPVTWPEVQVLMQLHGDENVMDIVPIQIGEVAPAHEKERLIARYGYRVVETVFPGRSFHMALMMTDDDKLPAYSEDAVSTKVEPDEDGSAPTEAEVRALAGQSPVFKPGRNKSEAAKEA
jgi:hypothetical protein